MLEQLLPVFHDMRWFVVDAVWWQLTETPRVDLAVVPEPMVKHPDKSVTVLSAEYEAAHPGPGFLDQIARPTTWPERPS